MADGRPPILLWFAAAWLTWVPCAASAHAVRHEVIRAGAVALHAFEDDGDPIADATYQVFSPSDPSHPWTTGRTDRKGNLAFLPDQPGAWKVKVVTADGHGFVADVSVEPPEAPAPSAPPSRGPAGLEGGGAGRGDGLPGWARPLATGALLLVALVLLRRRRGGQESAPGPGRGSTER